MTEPKTADLKWKALGESIVKLSTSVWRSNYGDSDNDDEEEKAEKKQGDEYRPKNAEIALTLLPVLKDKCGDRVPLATTSKGGTITLAWTNPQSFSRVVFSIRVSEKGYEFDVSKYPIDRLPEFRYFALSMTDGRIAEEDSIGETIAGFLGDISL